MQIRFGGTKLNLHKPRRGNRTKTWTIFILAILVLFTIYYMRGGSSDDDLGGAAGRVARDVDDYKPVGGVGRLQSDHERDSSDDEVGEKMAMDAVRSRYTIIAHVQKEILRNQVRPPDSKYNINVSLSDVISMDRDIPETRPEACLHKHYDISQLPKVSIVIPFYNEALSMLLRTIHSILNRTPDRLLNEIILVDDMSTRDYLKESLDRYIRLLPKVSIIRNEKRLGLIISRLNGYKLAKGPVVIFLDAHTEANTGWLEPLLDELQRHPDSVIQPFVDGIDAQTIQFASPPSIYQGSFSWDLRYTWLRVTDHEASKSIETGYPFFSATLVGCALAVTKKYFDRIGKFDEGLRVWGGENIELGFRVWMCGGRVVTVTCSRVGHVFKNFPYKFDGDKETIVQKNLIRVAEVWMDGMRKYFYASTRVYEFKRMTLNEEETKSLQERKDIRKKLHCKNFEWYMYNVIPQVEVPPNDAVYYGEIMSMKTRACFEVLDDYYVGMNYYCFEHKIIPKNNFYIGKDHLLHYRDKCVVTNPPNPMLTLGECPTDDLESFGLWDLSNRGHVWGNLVVRRKNSEGVIEKFCILQVTNVMPEHKREQMPQLGACDKADEYQVWAFTYKFQWDQVPKSVL